MINKRFTLDEENDDIIFDNNSITDSGVKELYWLIDCDQRQKLVDLLNELADENEQLKSLNQYLIELLEQSGATVEIERVKMND